MARQRRRRGSIKKPSETKVIITAGESTMPTPLAHFCVPLVVRELVRHKEVLPVKLLLVALFCSVAPDLDVIAFKLGIPYESEWGHRGFTHSLLFSVFMGLLFMQLHEYLNAKKLTVFIFITISWASHGILDAMTTGGLGIAFFWPLDNTRYFLPWQVIKVSPIGFGFFSERGIEVLKSEFYWVVIPSIFIIGIILATRKLTSNLNAKD